MKSIFNSGTTASNGVELEYDQTVEGTPFMKAETEDGEQWKFTVKDENTISLVSWGKDSVPDSVVEAFAEYDIEIVEGRL